jgi:superkiller protein 3
MGRMTKLSTAVLACMLALGCGGSQKHSDMPSAALPDEPPPPARNVPSASPLVKDGEAKLQQNDVQGARALFEQAAKENPSDARAQLDLGITSEALGDPKAAEAEYRKAVELDGNLGEALNNLGVLLRDHGKLDEAVPLLRRAAQANPSSSAAQANLGLALEDKGDLDGAEAAYRKSLQLKDPDLMTQVNLGLLLVGKNDLEGGKKELRAALPNAKDNRAALVAIGNGLRRASDAEGALQAMQAAAQTGGDPTPALLSELALAQRAAGDRDGAIKTLDHALELDPKYATAHYLLGNMYAGAKKVADAKKHFERYLALEPKGAQADQARERLKMLKTLK